MKLAHSAHPRAQESLIGFLMRAAEANHLPSIALYGWLKGRVVCPSNLADAERLAQTCGCSTSHVAQLFGFVRRRPDGARGWMIASEWITQARFVSSRKMAVCSACLREEAYLPAAWELTLYRACPYHRARLLATCPGCLRPLTWTRPSIVRCGCGFDLRVAPDQPASQPALLLAQLIENRIDARFTLAPSAVLPKHMIDRLATLTLEGLFKTIWFLGQRLGQFEDCHPGYGRAKPRAGAADEIIKKAFAMLEDWPGSLRERLAAMEGRAQHQATTRLYSRAFKPIVAYLEEEFAGEELTFLRLTYEQQLRRLWRASGGRNLPRQLDRQMEFELGC